MNDISNYALNVEEIISILEFEYNAGIWIGKYIFRFRNQELYVFNSMEGNNEISKSEVI